MRTPAVFIPLVIVFSLACASVLRAEDAAKQPEQASAAAGPPISEDECRALWNGAAGRSDLSPDQAKLFVTRFEDVDTNHDRKINNREFKIGCEKGFVHYPPKPPASVSTPQ